MENNKFRNVLIVLLIITIIGLTGWIIYDKVIVKQNSEKDNNITDKNDNKKEETNYILKEKTSFSNFCDNNNCDKNLGTVKINNKEYSLSVNLTNLNSYQPKGTISLGDKSIDISKVKSNDTKIEGFEIYDKYLIIYLKGIEEKDPFDTSSFHGYSMQIYDTNLNKISGLEGYTCGSFNDFKINNNILEYDSFMTIYAKIDIYNEKLNKNNYDVINVASKISMSNLLSGNYNESEILKINYNCGTSQQGL